MKGQAAVMEYMILILMTMFIIFFVVAMIFGFQFIEAGSSYSKDMEARTLFVLQNMLSSPAINIPESQKGSVLEDAKLSVMTCEDMESLFGEGIWVQVGTFYEKPVCEGIIPSERIACMYYRNEIEAIASRDCTGRGQNDYPECGTWTYCTDENKFGRMIYRSVPVNIYRKMEDAMMMGTLTVGISGGGS